MKENSKRKLLGLAILLLIFAQAFVFYGCSTERPDSASEEGEVPEAAAPEQAIEPKIATAEATLAPELEVVISDEHAASWMPISNAFTYKKRNRPYRTGYLLQMGKYYKDVNRSSMLPGFLKVELHGSGSAKELGDTSWDWIDVVAKRASNPSKKPPVPADYIGLLRADSTTTQCGSVDDCIVSRGRKCFTEKTPGDLKSLPTECVRNRTIQAYFEGNQKIITVWDGEETTRISTSTAPGHGDHARYTFSLFEPVDVTVYKNGKAVSPPDVGKLEKIVIIQKGHEHKHGEAHVPPIGGGK